MTPITHLNNVSIISNLYNFLVFFLISILLVSFVGYDPASICTPFIFIAGIILRQIKFNKIGFPTLLKFLNYFFCMFVIISFFWNPKWTWVYRLISGIIFFYFLNLYATSLKKMNGIFNSVLITCTIPSLVALFAIFGIWSPSSLFFPFYESNRFAGLYNTTILGIFTAVIMIWLIDEIIYPKLSKMHFLFKSVLLVLLFIQLLSTLTRSAWIGLAAGLLLYSVFEFRKINTKRYTAFMVAMIAIIIGLLTIISNTQLASSIKDRLIYDTLGKSEAEKKRASFYFTKNALVLASDHPFGVGIGNTQELTEKLEGLPVGAHNNFVMVLSDMGWFAFLFFVLIQLFLITRLFRCAFRNKDKYGVSCQMLMCSYVVILVSGLYQDLVLFLPMWLIPSLTSIVLFSSDNYPLDRTRRHI